MNGMSSVSMQIIRPTLAYSLSSWRFWYSLMTSRTRARQR